MGATSIVEKEEKEIIVKKDKSRIIYLDILNILACISVIALHCNGIVHTYTETKAWAQSLIVEVICYWAVPIYLMISGATLMNYRDKYDTKTFFKKRVKKVLIPFIFWTIVLIIKGAIEGKLEVDSWSIKSILNIFFLSQQESTYYFMFIILGVYLTMPVISVLADSKYRKILWYAVIAMFITKSTLPVISAGSGIVYNEYLSILFDGYLIFIMLGYLLSTMDISKKNRYIIYTLGIFSCILRYAVTYILSVKEGQLNNMLFGYVQFHSVFLAVAVFVFIKNIKWNKLIKKDKIKKAISAMSGCSFGIYLIHKLVIYTQIDTFNINEYTLKWRILGIASTYLISLIIVYIIKKIPILKNIVP